MSTFYLPSASTTDTTSTPLHLASSDSEDDTTSSLPFPAELPRSAFLDPAFNPSTYLSTLRNRHQTLEDLRSDLRSRSQLLSKELLDLVNGNYEEFLSLGGDLRGGEEKVEEVRVGLMAFQREIDTLRKGVGERVGEVERLLQERKAVRKDVVLGRALLEVDERIGELEESLGVTDRSDEGLNDEEDDEDDDGDANGIQVGRMRRHADQLRLIVLMVGRIGLEHPFLAAQGPRLEQIRKTILLDLASALRQAKTTSATDTTLALVKIYADLDASHEAVKVLKGG